MDQQTALRYALDPAQIFKQLGYEADPWQREFLLCRNKQILLNCSRGAGKSRTTSVKAIHKALFEAPALILLISKAQRQALELYRYVRQAYSALGRPVKLVKETETQMELENGSRIVALPGKEESIRSFQGVSLLILDEAARIPDELYHSVRPMVMVSKGSVIALSTPWGQRGWFYKEWHDTQADWTRFRIPWQRVPRYTQAEIDRERRTMGDAWVAQEFECSFEAMEGLVYPDFEDLTKTVSIEPFGQKVGGMDFGFRNPYCAVWGRLNNDDVLTINHCIYQRELPLHEIAKRLPKGYIWYADPSGATEIEELRSAGHKVLKAKNEIMLGIQAVTARMRTGRLKVASTLKPIFDEAKLYRYPDPSERQIIGEKPVDEHNHAMDALRYLVARVDKRFIATLRKKYKADHGGDDQATDLLDRAQSLYGARPKPNKTDEQQLWENPDVWNSFD